nr:retrotransposon protein, putative, unclassified [Tanacetum cinerariifolium]
TPMVEKYKLDEDKEGKAVDPSHYRGIIGTLLYLTASRPDLQFGICMCARYQARPIEKHLLQMRITLAAKILAGVHLELLDYGLAFNKIPMYCDNKSAIALCCNNVQHSRSKHINIRYHFIKEQVENGVIELYFVNTEYQLADLFTKVLGRDRIEFLTNKLGMRSFTPETLKKLMNDEDDTMATTLDQQVVLDEALVPSAQRAFLVMVDVLEIYMQEFWTIAKLHQHSIRFKIDTRKHVLDLEAFREMLHISPRISGQSFADLPFEEEILEFLSSNVDYAYLIWEDFVYQVEHKSQKKSNEMYYPRFTKVIIDYFMTRKPSIPRRNRVNWHYVRDDILFSTIKVAYREYYACATVEAAPKPKASARKKKSGSASSTTPPTPIATPTPRTTVGREESERDKTDASDDDNDDDDDEEETTKIGEQHIKESDEGDDEATKRDRENDDNNEEDQGLRIGEEERMQEEEEAEELYRDVDINQGQGLHVSQETEDSHMILTLTQCDAQQESSSTSSFMTNLLNPITDPGLESLFTTSSTIVTPTPSPQSTMTPSIISTFTSANRVKSLEDNFSNIPGNLQDSIQRENDEFLKTIDENMKKIIKEQVKTQVKAQVTRILPRIKEAVNAQLKAEVLTRSSHSSRTSYAVAANLSEMELKKILIDKMEGNKSIQRSDEQQNLYKALVEAYDADKTILDIYRESTILRRRREDDDQEGPSAGSDRGSKRRREGRENASASTPSEPATRSAGRSTTGSQSRQLSASESAFAEEPVQTTCQMEEPSHLVFETGADEQPVTPPNWPAAELVSRHQATQQYGVILPIELTNAEIRNSKAYQEYHACATREAAPKPKASARKKKGDSASSTTPPT